MTETAGRPDNCGKPISSFITPIGSMTFCMNLGHRQENMFHQPLPSTSPGGPNSSLRRRTDKEWQRGIRTSLISKTGVSSPPTRPSRSLQRPKTTRQSANHLSVECRNEKERERRQLLSKKTLVNMILSMITTWSVSFRTRMTTMITSVVELVHEGGTFFFFLEALYQVSPRRL